MLGSHSGLHLRPLVLLLQTHPDRLSHAALEQLGNALAGQGAALEVPALHLLLEDLPGSFAVDGGVAVAGEDVLPLSQVNFIPHEDLDGGGVGGAQFGVPLSGEASTFLRALR